MNIPSTAKEIKTAGQKIKNNKSPGNDNIKIELIKHEPYEVLEKIAEIYNNLVSTGDHPNEINHGILRALQKPGKAKGAPSNLGPIVLLSTLRKILAMCLMNRIGSRVDAVIPLSQAAYRLNISTTEQIFEIKLIIERAISSKNETNIT